MNTFMCFLFSVCVCNLNYPAYKANPPYYIVICGLSGCTIFFLHYHIKDKMFGKKFLNIKFVFSFINTFFSEIFLSIRVTKYVRYDCNCTYIFT
jgi:hypothetical protein